MSGWLAEARTVLPAAQGPVASKAAEWLLDNAYLVEGAIRQVQTDLPAKYYSRLPAWSSDGESALRGSTLSHTAWSTTRSSAQR